MWKWNAKYLIEENFLKAEHFEFLKNIKFEKSGIYANSIDKNANIFQSGNKIPDDVLLDIYHTYNSKLLNYLQELAPELVDKLTFTEITLIATDDKGVYPIHPDTEDKILSVVVYISPENNIGTILYRDKAGKDKYTIEWKQNRALIFSRKNDTWHSYNSDGKSMRVVLVYNLRQDDVSNIIKKLEIINNPIIHKEILAEKLKTGISKKKVLIENIKRCDLMIKKYTSLKRRYIRNLDFKRKSLSRIKRRADRLMFDQKNKSNEQNVM
jgi:hypothetical protein